MYASGVSSVVNSANVAVLAADFAKIGLSPKPARQEPSLKPFFVSAANFFDGTPSLLELTFCWLDDAGCALDDDVLVLSCCDELVICSLDDEDFSSESLLLEELSPCAMVFSISVIPASLVDSEQAQNRVADNAIRSFALFMFIFLSLILVLSCL